MCESRKDKTDASSGRPSSMFEVIERSLSSFAVERPVKILSEPGTYYGFTAGICTGFALKKVAKAAAFTFGAVFMGFQVASRTGYVNVNWKKVEDDVKRYLPEKPSDESDVINDAVKFLTDNTGIAATVFSVGFVAGLKLG